MASYTTVPLPPAKWAVRVPRVKGEESSYTIDWPLNTYNYPYCVVFERWSFYLGVHRDTYEEVIYSAVPCTLNDLGFPDTYLINTGHFERYFRPKGFTGAWTDRYEYTNTSIYGIKSIYYANYAIGDYTLPPVWQRRAVRVKIGSKNQKWANYPDTPNIVIDGVTVDSEHFPYQAITELEAMPFHGIEAGTYLVMSDDGPIDKSEGTNQIVIGVSGDAWFQLINGAWQYKLSGGGFYFSEIHEANCNVVIYSTGTVYFPKTTTPDMDYSPVRWAIRPVKVRVQ